MTLAQQAMINVSHTYHHVQMQSPSTINLIAACLQPAPNQTSSHKCSRAVQKPFFILLLQGMHQVSTDCSQLWFASSLGPLLHLVFADQRLPPPLCGPRFQVGSHYMYCRQSKKRPGALSSDALLLLCLAPCFRWGHTVCVAGSQAGV